MTKQESLNIVLNCSKIYHKNLENRNVIFIYQKEYKKYDYIETNFFPTIFEFKSNGTTQKKLEILSAIMQIDKKARIIGDYNSQKVYLSTEKLIGSVNMCLGFIKENNYYIANTALKEDIRNIVEEQRRILLVLKKNIKDKKYSEIIYKSKNVENTKFDEILTKLEIDNKVNKQFN